MIAWHKKNSDTSQQAGATTEAGAAAQPQVVQTDLKLRLTIKYFHLSRRNRRTGR